MMTIFRTSSDRRIPSRNRRARPAAKRARRVRDTPRAVNHSAPEQGKRGRSSKPSRTSGQRELLERFEERPRSAAEAAALALLLVGAGRAGVALLVRGLEALVPLVEGDAPDARDALA